MYSNVVIMYAPYPPSSFRQVNLAVGAQFNVFEAIGLTAPTLAKMREWSKTRSVSLRFRAEEKCKFLRKVR